jgi:hypothetical protein
LETYAAPLRAKSVDSIATDDVMAILKPIWTTKAETGSRVRGRIEKILDAAKAKGFREGENPARWRGHLDHLLPRPSKLSRGQHAAMPYEDAAAFIAKLREREAISAFCARTMHPDRRPFRGNLGNEVVRDRPQRENLGGARRPDEVGQGASGASIRIKYCRYSRITDEGWHTLRAEIVMARR